MVSRDGLQPMQAMDNVFIRVSLIPFMDDEVLRRMPEGFLLLRRAYIELRGKAHEDVGGGDREA